MLLFFILLSITMALFAVYFYVKYEQERRAGIFWFEKWRQSEAEYIQLHGDYEALDQGNTEIEENYQQEILSLHDVLERHVKAVNAQNENLVMLVQDRVFLMGLVDRCKTECLPTFRDEDAEKLADLRDRMPLIG